MSHRWPLAVTFIVLVTIGGCGWSRPTIVATDAVFPPFHYVEDDGTLAGFDVAFARAALERAGEPAQVVRAESYAALFERLMEGEYDVVAATTGITPERQARYAFTRPYFVTCLGVLVRAGPDEPTSPADLVGRRVAASVGTTSEAAAKRIEDVTFVPMTRWRDSLAALRAGDVDAVIIDEFEAVPFARDARDLAVLTEPAALESYGLVLRPDDLELRDRLDAAINALEADGTLAALRERFGLDRPAGWPIRLPRGRGPMQ